MGMATAIHLHIIPLIFSHKRIIGKSLILKFLVDG